MVVVLIIYTSLSSSTPSLSLCFPRRTLTVTSPTSEPVPTSEPEPITVSTLQPGSVTSVPINYCQAANQVDHHLTISFVLCIDYIYLLMFERRNIISRVSNFMNVSTDRVKMYRIVVPDQRRVYDNVRSPPGLTCSSRTKLDHSLADPGGWRSLYNGYQTTVDVYFSCKHAQQVFELVRKIKYEISLNKLPNHVGFHVIGWALYRWYCLQPTTKSVTR